MTPEVSVIIVTWNGKDYLGACLAAVAAQQDVAVETIVVDNGSKDGSVEFVRDAFPWVRVVALAENRGFAGGNNAGAREARGRYVAFLNNDTVADARWLRALRDGLDEEAGFALATSRIVYMHDPAVIDSAGDGVLRWGGAFKRYHGAPAARADRSEEVFGVCGAACLMPRAVFEELGGFDEDFFASHEDVDLSYRARLRGYRCRYVADALVRHHGSATMGKVSAFAVFHGQRNLEWMYFKNAPASVLARTLPGHIDLQRGGGGAFREARPLRDVRPRQDRGARRCAADRAEARRRAADTARERQRDLGAARTPVAVNQAAGEAVRRRPRRGGPLTWRRSRRSSSTTTPGRSCGARCSRSPTNWSAAAGRPSWWTTRRLTAAAPSRKSSRRTSGSCAMSTTSASAAASTREWPRRRRPSSSS